MKRQFLSMALVAVCAVAFLGQSARADILADGGSIITHPGGMTGTVAGADRSAISTNTPAATGFGSSMTGAFRVADDFSLANPINTINSMTFYTYQTGATAPSILTLTVQIWNGAPNAGGTVVWGDTTTNVLSSNAWMSGPSGLGVYRETNTGTVSTTRRIQTATASGLNINLGAGTYWVDWAMTGSVASGPWQPPVSAAGFFPVGNALQSNAGVYAAAVDAGALLNYAYPFTIEGTSIPEPGALSVLALGAVVGMLRRRK
jgi:hypothetical protein